MNNFLQKKIIANIKNNKDIPYQNTSDVSLKTNQNIHAVTLNNAFLLMVDNDLFNERHLIAYNNNSYGAKISADIDEYSAEDGTKIFDLGISNLNSSLLIYKKVEKPLSATLISFDNKIVNFFIETDFIDGNLIGTTNGLYLLKSVHDSLSTLIAYGNFISYYLDSANLIIATTNKLYKLNTLEERFNISVEVDFNINCIIVLDDNIYIGTNTGLKYCSINNLDNIYDIQGISSPVKALTTIDVNGYTKILAATENALYINENIVTFTKLRKINFENESLIYDYFYFDGSKFYVTNNRDICFLKIDEANRNNDEIATLLYEIGTNINNNLKVDCVYLFDSITYIVANNSLYKIALKDLVNNKITLEKLFEKEGLKKFSKFYSRYNVFFIESGDETVVYYNKNFNENLILLTTLKLSTSSILKFTNYNGNLYIITNTSIYILTEETISETLFVDYNTSLSDYTNISNFVRINSLLFGISSKSLVEINKNTSPTVYEFLDFSSDTGIKYVKQLNDQNNENFNGKIFIGDGSKLLAYNNISFETQCLSIDNVKDICFTKDYTVILSNDNTIRYFDISEDISAYILSDANSYSVPSDATLDSLDYHIISLKNNELSILEKTNIAKVNEFDYSNTSYSYISNDINDGNFAISAKLLYFNNFNLNLYLKDGSCFALNTLSKTEDGTFTIVFDENDTHDLTTLNYVPISALNPIASISTNSIIYSRKTVYDDLVYNKYYLLFGKNTNIISSYETKNNDLQIDSLSTLFYLETDDYNILSDIENSNVSENNVGFLTHICSSDTGLVYDTVAAVASNAKAMYTDAELLSQKLLSGGKYFAAPYPGELSTAKEDVQLEIGLLSNNYVTINNFRYLNKDTEGSYVLTTLSTRTGIVTSSYIGIDYVPTTVYTFNSTSSVSSYSFANNIFLYGPDGILKLNISVELSDSQTVDLTSYRNILAGNVKNVLTGNILKLRSYKIGNSYGLLFLSVNNQLTSTVSSILKYTLSTSLTSPGLTSINTIDIKNVLLNNVNISNITDFEIIDDKLDDKLYILSNNNLISGTFSNGSFTTSYSSENHNNKKLYRTLSSVIEIGSNATVFEDNHFHNTANRCFFVKQSDSITIYNENNINGLTISSIPNDITIADITGIRYVESEVSYFNLQTYDYVISSNNNEGLYIEDLIFNPGNLSANSLTISNVDNDIKFVGQFPTLIADINDNIISVDTYLFATNDKIYCKALNSSEPFINISSSNLIKLSGANITGTIKHIFIYNKICYVLVEENFYYKAYNLNAYIKINDNNDIEILLNSTEYEVLPKLYIGKNNSIEKMLIIPNYNGIGYYINYNNSYGIYTSEHLVELRNKYTLSGISKYYINGTTAFLVPTTNNNNSNISVYIPNSSYSAYRLNGISKNINSFNIIDNNVYVSYATNLSSFSINGIQFNSDKYIITDLREVNSFLRDKAVDNTLFEDTYQISNRFVNIQTSSYLVLSDINTSYTFGGSISSLIMTNDNSFRANVSFNNEKVVKDFIISSNGLIQNTLSIYGNKIAYMYNGEIYKTFSNEIYYYNGYSYGVLNYNNISNVYYISENVLFDTDTTNKKVYEYDSIDLYLTFKILNSDNINVGKYIDIDNNKYILEDNKKLYEILGIDGYSLCTYSRLTADYLFSDIIVDDTEINKFTADKKLRYMLLSNNNIFYTYDFNLYLKYKNNLNFLISTNNTIKDINSFNIHEYLIATDKGISCTKYLYEICANVFTLLTSEIQNEILSTVEADIKAHKNSYHNDTLRQDLIPYLNKNAVNVDFSDINIGSGKIINGSDTVYINDIVTNVEFDSLTPCLSVYQYIDNDYILLSDVSYIIKNYASGLKEMYLNIPTTNTYYIPHLEGNIGCNFANNNLYRKNVNKNIVGNPCSSNNEVYLFVSKELFKDLPLVEINGTSLPLSIYKDNEHTCMDAETYFHSYCLQSLVSEISDTQYLSTIISNVISNQNIATLTCNMVEYSLISAYPNVKFVTSVLTIVNNTLSDTNTTSTTSYVTYTSSYVTKNELTSLSTDQFFNTNSWRIKLRCFGTDEQSLILRKR